jgi:hypothetical protein
LLLTVGFFVIGIEEYIVNKAFSFMNHVADKFEQGFADDVDDMERFQKNAKEREEYDDLKRKIDDQMFNTGMTDKGTYRNGDSHQKSLCEYQKSAAKSEKLYELAYVKHNPAVRDELTSKITLYKKFVNEAVSKKEYDPTQCLDDPT